MRKKSREDDTDERVREFVARDRRQWREARAADYQRITTVHGLKLDAELASDLIGMLTGGTIRRYLSHTEAPTRTGKPTADRMTRSPDSSRAAGFDRRRPAATAAFRCPLNASYLRRLTECAS